MGEILKNKMGQGINNGISAYTETERSEKTMFQTIRLKPLALSIGLALLAGALGALLGGGMNLDGIQSPWFMPPPIVFPIAWTILYVLMGTAAYLIYDSGHPQKKEALQVYALQLVVNSLWSLFFFRLHWFLFSFLWILFLIVLVCLTIYQFYAIEKKAAYLMLPYLIWLLFAALLAFSVYRLN